MRYMLDTNICIYTIKHKPETVIRNFLLHKPEEMHGVEKSAAAEKNRIALSLFLSPLSVLDFSASAAAEYGKIRAALELRGRPIGPMDLLIAGHAKSEKLILVTNNTKEFLRVEGLAVENWAD